MSNITKTVEWKTSKGKTVTATCKLTTEKTVFADGYNVSVKCCEKTFSISVEGHGSVGYYITRTPRAVKGVQYAATCGPLAITAENLKAIDSMVKSIEQAPEWVAKQARIAKSNEVEKDYQAHCNMMRKTMAK